MVVEGEEVRAFVELSESDATITKIWAEKRDDTPVLTSTAAIGPDHGELELDRRRAKLRPHEQLAILSVLELGKELD